MAHNYAGLSFGSVRCRRADFCPLSQTPFIILLITLKWSAREAKGLTFSERPVGGGPECARVLNAEHRCD